MQNRNDQIDAELPAAGPCDWYFHVNKMFCDVSSASGLARSSNRVALAIAFFACLSTAGYLKAQAPRVEVAISSDSIFIGETIDLQVEVQNSEDPKAPDLTPLKETFEIENLGNESRNQSSTIIINGRMSQRNIFAHVYAYRLTPKLAGKLSIPPLTVSVDGKEIKSSAISVEVQDAEIQDVVLIDVVPSRRTLFPTQSFSVTLKILVKPLPDSRRDPLQAVRRPPPQLTVGWIDPPEGLQTEDKSDFLQSKLSKSGIGFTLNDYSTQGVSLFDSPRKAVFDLNSGRETRKDLEGNEVEYFVYELTRSFVANRTGTFTFDNALVKGVFVTGEKEGEYQGRRIVAIAPSIAVEVKDVPTDRPDNYTGGIGQYQMSASATPTSLRVGDPLTLSLEFAQGKQGGSLDLLSPPNLRLLQDLVDDFEIVDSNPTGRLEGNTKKFSFALRPKRPDVNIPAIKLSSFDPEREEFSEIATEPIALKVTEASILGNNEIVGAISGKPSVAMKQSGEGIFGNLTDPSLVRDDLPRWQGPIGVVFTVWSLSAAGIVAIFLGRRKDRSPAMEKKNRAKQNAMTVLQKARLQSDNPKEAIRLVRLAVLGFVADSQGRSSDGMTKADVQNALERSSASADDRGEWMRLLDDIDSMEYGAGAGPGAATLDYVERAAELVNRTGPLLTKTSSASNKKIEVTSR